MFEISGETCGGTCHLQPVRGGARGLCRYAGLVRDLAARRASEQQAQLATAAERATSATAALRQVPSRQQHLVIPQVPAGVWQS